MAMNGVPAAGPLEMLAHDPETRGEALFAKSCASCHVLGDLGDRKKATAPTLDGWGTEPWVLAMMHDPDGEARFGKTPFAEMMPSMDVPPKDRKPDDPPFKAMSAEDMRAAAAFLASQGDEAGDVIDANAARRDPETVKKGQAIVTTRCTTCHLWRGEGDDSSQGAAPELSGYGSVAWARAQITNPATAATYREGALDAKMKGHMPRFDEELAAEDVDLLARWVRAHARGVPLGAGRTAARTEGATPAETNAKRADGGNGALAADAGARD
jgi:ubiquinol-cytochrome c reductase cytochrome b subunit